jgi:hypothetical protein
MDTNYILIAFDNLDIIKEDEIQDENCFVNKNEYIFLENKKSLYVFSDKNTEKEHIFQIDTKEYLKDISNSYNNLDSIKRQFIVDINRLDLFYNNKKIKNYQLFFDYLDYRYNIMMQKKIIMCCTQACLGLPFYILMKFLNRENIYLTDIYLSDINNSLKKFKISLLSKKEKLEFNVDKYLRICKINKNSEYETLYIIKVNLFSDLLNDKFILMSIKMIKYI